MKSFRVLASGLLLLCAALGIALWYAAQHEDQLVGLILAQIEKRTGLQIQTSGTRLGLGTRLVVVLEEPRVIVDHQERARLGTIRAVFSYWSLLHRNGLPLYDLAFERGSIIIGQQPSRSSLLNSPASHLKLLTHYLETLSGISRRFDLVDLTLSDQDNHSLAQHVSAVAYQAHYRGSTWPWVVNFKAEAAQPIIAGAYFSGDLELGPQPSGIVAEGQVWFWELPTKQITIAGFHPAADLEGNLRLTLSADNQAAGDFTVDTTDMVVTGPALSAPVTFGRLWSRSDYRVSSGRAQLSNLELRRNQVAVFKADATVSNPFDSKRELAFSAGGMAIELADTARWLRPLQAVSPSVVHLAERLRSGTLLVNRIALNTPQPLEKLQLEKLCRQLEINAALMRVSYVPPPALAVPPVYQFDAQLNYSGGVARVIQGTGQVGGTSISDMNFDVNLAKAPAQIDYRIKLSSWLDVGEMFDATSGLISRSEPQLRSQILWVHGHTPLQLQANGTIKDLHPLIPKNYDIRANLGDVQFELSKVPGAIWLNSGRVALQPGRISFNKLIAIPLDQTGNIVVTGAILADSKQLQFRDFTVELHQIASDKWVPRMVNPSQLSVFGPIGGKLVANSKAGTTIPTVTGKLTLDHGTVQPGFLRSPIMVTHSATLVLDGKGLVLNLPASRLEGEPLNFRMAISDFNHPQVRIDARVAYLDFEVMRFIRLPWSPSTPPQFFPVPVTGHIEAQSGNFDKLAMSKISTDFYHNSQTWEVDNFNATAFNGSIALTISGRARDDWVNMKGVIAHMDAGPLFLLSSNSQAPPILGKLSATGDLWANTGTNFFQTLAGTVSITMSDGTLNRFTLMKRILSLVNLKNYLTAQFPDPRKSGVPFNSLDADFRGARGDFYTDNLRLNGPVMDITARGNIDFANNTMDMEIDLLALQTVTWLINNIPIIGKHLGGATKHLVGAYFQVRGPTSNPTIRPKPLTSVAQFVLKTLMLPINIIAPDTIE